MNKFSSNFNFQSRFVHSSIEFENTHFSSLLVSLFIENISENRRMRKEKKLLIKIPENILAATFHLFFFLLFVSFQILLRKPDEIISLRSPPKARTPPSTSSSRSTEESRKGKETYTTAHTTKIDKTCLLR